MYNPPIFVTLFAMSVNKFLLLMSLAGSGSWFAFVTVLFYIDPATSGAIGLIAFYVSLFLALLATFTLLGLVGRVALKKYRQESLPIFRLLLPALRQSIWLSLIVIVSFMLLAANVFTVGSVTILVMGFTLLEAFYLSRTEGRTRETEEREIFHDRA